MFQALEDRAAFDDAVHEERELGADAQDHHARSAPAQLLRLLGGDRDVVERLVGAPVPQLWREPHLETPIQCLFASEHEPVEVLAADPDHVAVKIRLDDFELAAHLDQREIGSPVLSQHDPPDVVADSSSLHRICQSRLTNGSLSI